MAVNHDIYGNLNIGDLPLELIDFEDILKEESRKNTDSLSKLCSQLCVPPDPIEDLEWFPSFFDDLIALDLKDLGLVPIDPAHDKQFYNFPITLEGQEDFKSTNDVKLVADAPSCGKQSYIDYFPVTPQLREKKSKNIDKDVIEHGLLGFTWKKRARTKNYYKRRENVTWMKKKCSHCETDETPQWRNGPKGPKTLCNACGVRFKSGRLVPEYRPALSPTFDSTKHSNFHKRILRKLFLCWK